MRTTLITLVLFISFAYAKGQVSYETERSDSSFVEGTYFDIPNGVTLYLQCEISGGQITSLKRVEQITSADNVITVEYRQNTLTVKNPFDFALGYNAYAYSSSMDRYYWMEPYPVQPGLAGSEMFQLAFKQLRLSDFQIGSIEELYAMRKTMMDWMNMQRDAKKKRKKKK